MIRVAICDNDIRDLESLYRLVRDQLHAEAKDEHLIRRFHSVYDLLECLENPDLTFDVYILCIDTPIMGGIEVGRLIRKSDDYAAIIYTHTSRDRALEAMDTAPLAYLAKPIDGARLGEALRAALRKFEAGSGKHILVKRKDGLANVALHEIEYVEYKNHALTFHLRDGRSVESRVIQASFSGVCESTLSDPRFVKPHASYAINMDRVRALLPSEFEMETGARVPISKRVYADVKRRYLQYMQDQHGATVL